MTHMLSLVDNPRKHTYTQFRAVASMYSLGGGAVSGKNFRMTKKISESFMAYEATKAATWEALDDWGGG
jgi:hypothetical protein